MKPLNYRSILNPGSLVFSGCRVSLLLFSFEKTLFENVKNGEKAQLVYSVRSEI